LARLNPAPPADLSQKFPHADKEALAILKGMLTFLASDRLTLDQALDNPFLASAETPDDVDDETTVNYKPVKLARKSSNLAVRRPAHDAHSPDALSFISLNLPGCQLACLFGCEASMSLNSIVPCPCFSIPLSCPVPLLLELTELQRWEVLQPYFAGSHVLFSRPRIF